MITPFQEGYNQYWKDGGQDITNPYRGKNRIKAREWDDGWWKAIDEHEQVIVSVEAGR